MASNAPRPILITILAILEFLGGLLFLLAGIVIVAGVVTTADVPELAELGSIGGIGMIIVGLIALIIAGGFWNGWSIMWYLGVIFNAISAIFIVYTMVTGGGIVAGIIPLIIELVILFYLFRPGVKSFFGI